MWWALITLAVYLVPQPYVSVHKSFETKKDCQAFVKMFKQTFDEKASGAEIRSVRCVRAGK